MKILYAALKYDYGRAEQGHSFEHYNFYDSLVRMGHDILYFDTGMARHVGREATNRLLRDVVRHERPDLMFTVLFGHELEENVVRTISTDTDTITLNWFCDDHWRFDAYSRYWAPQFNWVVTTSAEAAVKYQAFGHANVIRSQWACNHFLYQPTRADERYDVTFVGLPHGDRRYVIQTLRDAGIDVGVWGQGWEAGRLSQDEMIRVFGSSKINLNLSNAAAGRSVRARASALAFRAVASAHLPRRLHASAVRAIGAYDRRARASGGPAYPEQIKGRNFEIPGCGGFQLSGQAENLGDYYTLGKEVACYLDLEDLITRVRYFLREPEHRRAIAASGYERTLREHTYVHRLTGIFNRIGLGTGPPVHAILDGSVSRGITEVVQA
jgi:spore maturation protein CgeB